MKKEKYENVDISLFHVKIFDNKYFNKTTCDLFKKNIETCSIDIEIFKNNFAWYWYCIA